MSLLQQSATFRLRNLTPAQQRSIYDAGAACRVAGQDALWNPYIGVPARLWSMGWRNESMDPKKLVYEAPRLPWSCPST